jgi:hypothetical protein
VKTNEELARIALSRLGMNGKELQHRLADIQAQVLRDKKGLLADHPQWDPRTDIRVTSLNNLFSVLGRTALQIQFLGEMLDEDWWQTSAGRTPQRARSELLIGLEQSIKYSFGMDFFSGIEVAFRTFLRAIDPLACRGATGSFTAVHDCLLGNTQLGLPRDERAAAKELLEFVRLLRNLIHGGGVYFDATGADREVGWAGKHYRFRHGQPVDFVYWDLLLSLADDIRRLLTQVIRNSKIASLNRVADPHYA